MSKRDWPSIWWLGMLGGTGCQEVIPICGNWDFLSYGSPRISALQLLLDCLCNLHLWRQCLPFTTRLVGTHLLTTFFLRMILLNLWNLLKFLPSLAVQTMSSLSHSIRLWYHSSSTRIVSQVRLSFQALLLTLVLQFVSPCTDPILSCTHPAR